MALDKRSQVSLTFGTFMRVCLLMPCGPPAGKGLTSWLSFVMSNWEFVSFSLVSWVWYLIVSYDVASESELTPCNKINKPLVLIDLRQTL